ARAPVGGRGRDRGELREERGVREARWTCDARAAQARGGGRGGRGGPPQLPALRRRLRRAARRHGDERRPRAPRRARGVFRGVKRGATFAGDGGTSAHGDATASLDESSD